MRVPTGAFAAAGLLLFAITSFAVGVTGGGGSVGSHPAGGGDASCSQDGAAPAQIPGTRCTRERPERCTRAGEGNNAPVVELKASEQKIVLSCKEGTPSADCMPSASQQVQLTAEAKDPDEDTLLYTYSATGGRATGDGANVTWDLTGLRPGTYTATVEVDDGCGCVAFHSVRVKVETCGGCDSPLR